MAKRLSFGKEFDSSAYGMALTFLKSYRTIDHESALILHQIHQIQTQQCLESERASLSFVRFLADSSSLNVKFLE